MDTIEERSALYEERVGVFVLSWQQSSEGFIATRFHCPKCDTVFQRDARKKKPFLCPRGCNKGLSLNKVRRN
jgi:hypothetical protein